MSRSEPWKSGKERVEGLSEGEKGRGAGVSGDGEVVVEESGPVQYYDDEEEGFDDKDMEELAYEDDPLEHGGYDDED